MCPAGTHCQSSVCSFRVGPSGSRILLPPLCSQLGLLQSPVLAPEAARSLQGSLGCRVGKGGSSPGSTGTASLTDTHRAITSGTGSTARPCQTEAGGDLPGPAWTATSCAVGWHCVRNSIHQLLVRWEHWDLGSECPAHTPQRPQERPQLHTRVWSPTQAQKPKCPQRQTCLSLGPSVSMPLLKNASAQGMGQLCSPCPSAASWGTSSGLWGGLGAAAEPSSSHRFTQNVRARARQGGHAATSAGGRVPPRRASPGPCTQQGREQRRV